MLARNGYGVLLFDRRGEGESDGKSNLLGWGGDKDILAAIGFLKARPDVDPGRIGGLGLSVGGELMLQAAAETDELAAVVSEGAGTRQFSEQMEEFHGFRRLLLAPQMLILTGSVAVFGSTAPPPNLTDVAPRIEQPLFVIWAPNGGNIEHMSKTYYALASGPKQIWEMPSARHVGGIYDRPAEYERRVVGFFDEALLQP
jgi:dienelactone hydrolase